MLPGLELYRLRSGVSNTRRISYPLPGCSLKRPKSIYDKSLSMIGLRFNSYRRDL